MCCSNNHHQSAQVRRRQRRQERLERNLVRAGISPDTLHQISSRTVGGVPAPILEPVKTASVPVVVTPSESTLSSAPPPYSTIDRSKGPYDAAPPSPSTSRTRTRARSQPQHQPLSSQALLPPAPSQSSFLESRVPVDGETESKLLPLRVKVPRGLPIMNDPYQNPEKYYDGPDSEERDCKGGHVEKRVFGIGGLIGGICFFPWGLFWTRCDSRLICKRCGLVLQANQSHPNRNAPPSRMIDHAPAQRSVSKVPRRVIMSEQEQVVKAL